MTNGDANHAHAVRHLQKPDDRADDDEFVAALHQMAELLAAIAAGQAAMTAAIAAVPAATASLFVTALKAKQQP